jgi:hypothetical protein
VKIIYIFCLSIATLALLHSTAYSFAQLKWETFKDNNIGLSMQIPSNWIPQKMLEDERSAPIDVYIKSPPTRNNSFASVEIYADESSFYNQSDSIATSLSEYANENNFKLLQPIECGKHTLNNLIACSFMGTYMGTFDDGEDNANLTVIDVLARGPNGIEYETEFTASNDLYDNDQFLPSAEYMIKSISMDPVKVAYVLNVTSANNP